MVEQPIDAIDEAALQYMIDNQVSEGRDLEFKRELPGGGDEASREFLADVTAFANAQGGDIVYGMDEANGAAADLFAVRTFSGISSHSMAAVGPRSSDAAWPST